MKRMLMMLAVALLAVRAMAATEVVNGITWTYTVSGSEASVGTGEWAMPAISESTTGAITIPATLGGYPVTSIGECAFYGCSGLTSVTIPSSVTSIGISAFSGCSGLTSVTIPSSVTYIGYRVFYGCSGLTSVTIPSGVTSIGESAFYGCSGLTSVTIPSSVTNIGGSAFSGCSGLTSVTIPSGVTSISGSEFYGCSGLVSFDVDEGNSVYTSANGLLLTKDGKTLVMGVNGDVVIPSGVTSIGEHAFYGCSGLTSVMIPSSVTYIGDSAFAHCSGLTSVTISNSVTSIGTWAFYDCSGLTSVTLEGDAPVSGTDIFEGTPSDMVVHVRENSSGWTQWNGRMIRFDADGGTAASTVNMNLTVTNVVIHYIVNSVQPEKAIPASYDTGFVNIITEVKSGGAVSVPVTWMVNYPNYIKKFGSDFTKSLVKPTGKRDGAGNAMLVWQDYVAGTDPTDESDVFTASITMVEGVPKISYSPEFRDANEAKLRKYTTWGKKSLLSGDDWEEVKAGHEADYNFFKVTVEMR